MYNDIDKDGNNKFRVNALKAVQSHDYKLSKKKAVRTCYDNGHYDKLASLQSEKMKQKDAFGASNASKHWFKVYSNLECKEKYFMKRNTKTRETRERNGSWIKDEYRSDWELYSKKVRKLTESNYKKYKK